eukprot:6178787-Pleurochrysis_carterae.AAC.1
MDVRTCASGHRPVRAREHGRALLAACISALRRKQRGRERDAFGTQQCNPKKSSLGVRVTRWQAIARSDTATRKQMRRREGEKARECTGPRARREHVSVEAVAVRLTACGYGRAGTAVRVHPCGYARAGTPVR